MSMIPKTGRVVITGSSSGIGAAYADRLARGGHPLMLVARRQRQLKALAERLRADFDADVEIVVADLEDASQLRGLEGRLRTEPIAALINNAGAGGLGPTAATTADRLETLIRLNVVALTRLSHAVLVGFRERGAGVLVNIGSVVAFSPSPNAAIYSGTKAFVLNFTRSLQLEYANSAIGIQLVMPGPVRTEFFSSQGMDGSVFPDQSYLTAEDLVDAALSGLDMGEEVTLPAVSDLIGWDRMEIARKDFMMRNLSGKVAQRYAGRTA